MLFVKACIYNIRFSVNIKFENKIIKAVMLSSFCVSTNNFPLVNIQSVHR